MYNTALISLPLPPCILTTTTTNSSNRESSSSSSRLAVGVGSRNIILPRFINRSSTMVVMANNRSLDITPDNSSVILSQPLSLSSVDSPEPTTDNNPNPNPQRGGGGGGGNAIQRVLSLFSNVRFGSDLTQFQMPPQFNIPKSQLQCYGESICCTKNDLLAECVKPNSTPLQRMASVVAWSVSTLRPLPFGFAPYNPVLGETHHLSRGDHLHVFLEQVSHHPPISALHGTDERNNIELLWCHHPSSKFYGTSIESKIHGKRRLTLKSKGENYVMNSPTLFIRFMPFPVVDWIGDVKITCQETGLRAEITYNSCSFFGFQRGGDRYLKGKIIDSNTAKTLAEIDGHWDRIVEAKDTAKGITTVIYDARQNIRMLQPPTLLGDAKDVLKTESAKIWAEVSKAIMGSDWDKANKGKRIIEENQRELTKQRKLNAEKWIPNHFTLTHNKEDGWTCTPKSSQVLQSPIVFELS